MERRKMQHFVVELQNGKKYDVTISKGRMTGLWVVDTPFGIFQVKDQSITDAFQAISKENSTPQCG
jgi:hypothetical protein